MREHLTPHCLANKIRFSLLARAGGLRPYSPTLEGAGFYRHIRTGLRIIENHLSLIRRSKWKEKGLFID